MSAWRRLVLVLVSVLECDYELHGATRSFSLDMTTTTSPTTIDQSTNQAFGPARATSGSTLFGATMRT